MSLYRAIRDAASSAVKLSISIQTREVAGLTSGLVSSEIELLTTVVAFQVIIYHNPALAIARVRDGVDLALSIE